MRGPTYRKLLDDYRHDLKNLGISCIRDIAVVIDKNSIKQGWYHIGANHFEIVSSLDICLDELQDFLLDCSKSSNLWHLGSNLT